MLFWVVVDSQPELQKSFGNRKDYGHTVIMNKEGKYQNSGKEDDLEAFLTSDLTDFKPLVQPIKIIDTRKGTETTKDGTAVSDEL